MRGWRHWPGACPGALQCGLLLQGIREWLFVPEHLLSLGTALLYIQIACALAGSLSKFYCGVPVADLAVALFGLIAIESGIQLLLRLYLVLLLGCMLLDISWFIFVGIELRAIVNSGKLSVYIFIALQATSSIFRLSSAFIWIALVRHGLSASDAASYQPVDFETRLPVIAKVSSSGSLWQEDYNCEASSQGETLAGSIYDPIYFSSLFEDTKDGEHHLKLQCCND